MPIPILGKLVKGFVGTDGIVDAVDVETTGPSNVQAEINNLGGAKKIRTTPSIDATNAASFASSLTSQTPGLGDGYIVSTAGEPFTGVSVKAAVGDIIYSRVASPSLTDVTHWGIDRNAQAIPVSATSDLFLQQLAVANGVFGFTSSVKIDQDNVASNYRNVIEGSNSSQVQAEITSLNNKVSALYPLTVDVPYLVDFGNIYRPTQASESVDETRGYSLFADFRADADRYESTGVTYTAGSGVVSYSGLTDDLHRAFGFRVAAAAATTLMSITDGVTQIPFVDMTVAGNFRVNNFRPAQTTSSTVTNQVSFATLTSGTGTIAQGGPVSTYTLQRYPTDSSSQTRSASVEFDVLINGVADRAGGGVFFDIPDTNAASTTDVEHTFFTGFPDNRSITATFRFVTRVSGADLLMDISLISAPSDVTFSIDNVDTPQSYTTTNTIPRTDNWIVLQDAAGDFVFTGSHELLIVFHPIPSTLQTEVVPVVVNTATGAVDELNDALISIPTPLFDEVQIPDTIEFRTFLPDHYLVHRDLSNLLTDRDTKWAYGLARLNTVTIRALTAPIDLNQGTTLNGNNFTRDISGTAIGGTGNSVLTLPTDYASFETLMYTVVEDGGQTTNHIMMTRELEANATIDPIRISGNDTATWNRTARTLTLHETTDTWVQAVLAFPRQS